MKGSKNICEVKTCRNYQRYCRLHQGYTVPEKPEVNKVSEKKKELDKKYRKVRAQYLREHPLCEAKIEGCKGVASEIHHRSGRVGDNYINANTFLATCRSCHLIIEASPAFARQTGLSESRLKPVNK